MVRGNRDTTHARAVGCGASHRTPRDVTGVSGTRRSRGVLFFHLRNETKTRKRPSPQSHDSLFTLTTHFEARGTRRMTGSYGEEAVLARKAETPVQGLQPVSPREGETQVRGVQLLPARETEIRLQGVQPLPSREAEKQLRGLHPLPSREGETQLHEV